MGVTLDLNLNYQHIGILKFICGDCGGVSGIYLCCIVEEFTFDSDL